MAQAGTLGRRPRVVVVGAGFGGLSLTKDLDGTNFDITLIDRHNYHLFQPLLYQVATAGLSPAEIASPIRNILRAQQNATVVLAEVSGVDLARKEVIAEGRRIPFDTLILATGAEHAYFGHDDWAPFAPGLKTIDDATYLRRRILLAFECAETEPEPEERQRLLNFVVVGGGPTGVEMAGAIAELAKRALASDFRTIDPRSARIILVEAGPRLLTPFDPKLSENAKCALEQLGVEVRLNTAVTGCDDTHVATGNNRIETRTIMWAAGVKASPAARWLDVESDRAGRVRVEADLSVKGLPDVFVLGDTALALDHEGKPLPGVAPVAKARPISRYTVEGARGRQISSTIPLSRFWFTGDDRTQARCFPTRPDQAHRLRRMGALEHRSYLFPDRLPESSRRRHELGLELRDIPARHPPDYGYFGCAARCERGW
jgi:NADH:ubiquinone reductase (H+-translocating)